jgi:hypothetical protein
VIDYIEKTISYFADTTERGDSGWKETERQGDFADNSIISSISLGQKFVCFVSHMEISQTTAPLCRCALGTIGNPNKWVEKCS